MKAVKLSGNVGFKSIPEQVYKYSQRTPFILNLLIIGESGLGKSKVINHIFGTNIYPAKIDKNPTSDVPTSIKMQNYSCELSEKGVTLKVTVVDALGYSDLEDNTNCWDVIQDNIEERLDAYFEQEARVNRKKIIDNRIHCCLFFISPTGHSLKQLDIETMKKIQDRVFIIPIIAKADTLTEDERNAFKKRVLSDLEFHKIKTFSLDIDTEVDPNTKSLKKDIMSKMPFAVIAADKDVEIDGKIVKGRKYPWGVVNAEDPHHSDLLILRELLVSKFNEEIRVRSYEIYESYRREKMGATPEGSSEKVKKVENSSPFAAFEDQKKNHEEKLKELERELKNDLEKKKKEKESKYTETMKKIEEEEHDFKVKIDFRRREKSEKEKALQDKQAASSEKDKKKKK